MAMTKSEAAKLTQDLLLRGVIETVIKESQLLQLLPFMEVTGTAVTYNREATLPAASFYDVGDTWTEATPTFTTVTAALKIMGGDADVGRWHRLACAGAESRRGRGICIWNAWRSGARSWWRPARSCALLRIDEGPSAGNTSISGRRRDGSESASSWWSAHA